MVTNATNYCIQGEGYSQEEEYYGTRGVWRNDEDERLIVANQLVSRFNPLKHKHFYKYLSQTFMKEYKNYIRLYDTIVRLISR